jgi:hypothetical protein
MTEASESSSIAGVLERTCWDYSPADAGIGLLSPMSRYFRSFPWEGRRIDGVAAGSREAVEADVFLEEPDGP